MIHPDSCAVYNFEPWENPITRILIYLASVKIKYPEL